MYFIGCKLCRGGRSTLYRSTCHSVVEWTRGALLMKLIDGGGGGGASAVRRAAESHAKRRPDDRPPPSRALINFILVAGLVAVAVARHERLQYQQVGIQVSPRSVDGESE